MDFTYPRVFMLEAYERVLLDCMQGDQMLFVREDGVSEAWAVLTPVVEKIEAEGGRGLARYPAGSEGPAEADRMMEREGRVWRTM
jgi:glucose-6-phosphate 1-dehydrogenase